MELSASLYRDGAARALSPEEEARKRELYEKIPVRRRKFIERIGYEHWDPFQKPNDPIELRKDPGQRTTRQLFREFMQSLPQDRDKGAAYAQGALECALGVVNRDEKSLGCFDFACWYQALLLKEGHRL